MFNASSFLMFSQEVQGKAQIHSDNLPNIRKKNKRIYIDPRIDSYIISWLML